MTTTSRYLAIVLVGFAAYVVGVAVPTIRDSLIAQSSINTIAALRRGEPVPVGEVGAALDTLGPFNETATGDRLINQGVLSLVHAQQLEEDDPVRVGLLVDAKRLAEARLERAANDTHAWARLSYAEYLLNGPSELAISALRHSYETGPMEYYALWPRLRLGVILWAFLDAEMRDATMAQAMTALRAGGGSYRLAQFYFSIPNYVQAELMQRVQGAEGQEDFERFLQQERQRRQGA